MVGGKKMEYIIGLDIGTNSVGWCVTNRDNQLVKFKGKKMWGVRLFEKGDTAAATRIKRGQRRRYMRRHRRIRLLQELIASIILPIDPDLFIRLEDSFFFKEDKRIKSEYTLFTDKDYTDSDYYKAYPTIYHLRNELVYSKEKADPRLIYLALHHIIKYRGNFLYEGQTFKGTENGIEETIEELMNLLKEQEEYKVGEIVAKELVTYLENKEQRKREKQEAINKYLTLQGMDKKLAVEIAKALLGYSFDLSVLFNDKDIIDDSSKALSVKFLDGTYEDKLDLIENILQDRFPIVETLHKLYSQYVLSSILQGKSYISEAMLARYEKHKQDLKSLKRLVREVNPKAYKMLFRDEFEEEVKKSSKQEDKKLIKNYVNYIKGNKKCSQEELYKTIKVVLADATPNHPDSQYCLKEMEELRFLNRLNHRENSAIPWQMNQVELEKIIENQGVYYPVLKENKEKIMSLLSFRIPYYVGPLNPATSHRFAWVKRTEEKIYPWNFFEVVKEEETAEGFISRMTNYCTYLPTEKVIPKHSLLYSRYNVLNELANIRVDGKTLEPEDKKRIIEDLFKHYKRITNQRFCDWLRKVQWNGQNEFNVTGYQKENEFASSLESTVDFYKILQRTPDKTDEVMIEQIVYWLTIFEEKSIVEKKITKEYGTKLSEKQIKRILGLRYKGWSRLSRRLLTGLNIKHDEMNYNIMYYLENTKMNFMQILTDKELGFCKLIEAEQQALQKETITIDDVMSLRSSPAIKRGVWQTIQIIDEIIKCMGKKPSHIMIEVAREDQDSGRTQSRKSKLIKAFEQLKQETQEYNDKVVKELKEREKQLNSERVFLYFIQNGKCMYTQKPLNIDELANYEVDHIIPRCYIKDDSIENKALVYKIENQHKSSNLLLEPRVQSQENKEWWQQLYKHGLIGSKKLTNLMREGFSEREQKGFINRQLVETRQICKQIVRLLQENYVNTDVVMVKAQLSSLFREKYSLYKNRNINDLHHAQDAYLAAVIGNTLLLNHESDSAEWLYNDYVKYFKKKKSSRKEKQGYILSMFDRTITNDQGTVVWEGEQSLNEVLKVFRYKNCLFTKKLEEGTGQFYDETIYGRDSNKKDLIPLKEGLDAKKYGGYSGANNAYSVAITYRNKKKIEKKLIGIPIKISYDIKSGKIRLEQYLENLGYKEVQILRPRVLKYQLIEEDNNLYYIASFQEVCNAKQLMLEKEHNQLIYWMNEQKTKELEEHVEEVNQFYEYLMNKVKDFYRGYHSVWAVIEENIDFTNLRIEEKYILIMEILRLTKADAQNANLKRLNKKLTERAGRKQKTINLEDVTFIDQSITGLFERRETF